ncbi:PREDICTED: uncharacterized protein LOC109586781 [Amphimedon queenslandica]|uniref:Uncharacterized protein n=1 Tax=Amphimedon queenslandica TaxID=400682 RepID=A0AAN0JNF2_AMPQE|nr:PREDICTED: uncharacterized protein LOC109586781 [Amphimedon queenslandica]|eukprot:XP_019858548.1 PREDICTED: uncharacterized protein LOC109586781 [Amphimedon queenslandica]
MDITGSVPVPLYQHCNISIVFINEAGSSEPFILAFNTTPTPSPTGTSPPDLLPEIIGATVGGAVLLIIIIVIVVVVICCKNSISSFINIIISLIGRAGVVWSCLFAMIFKGQ